MTQAQCPSCARLQEPRLFCSECGAPLAAELDYFAALGLPRRLTIDPQHLETLYHELGRRVHPDRFANSAVAVRDASLNRHRAAHAGVSHFARPGEPGALLAGTARREAGDRQQESPARVGGIDLRGAGDAGGVAGVVSRRRCAEDDAARPGRGAKSRLWMRRLRDALCGAGEKFRQVGFCCKRSARALIVQLKGILSRINYLRTLVRDVDRELEVHDLG